MPTPSPDLSLSPQSVTIVGGGLMGTGIARCAVEADLGVAVFEPDSGRRRRGVEEVAAQWPDSLEDALDGAELVIEAVPEDLALKLETFGALSALASPTAILASNTSSIPIGRLAREVTGSHRVVGLHFFSPVERMQLVEVVSALATSAGTLERAMSFCRSIAKVPVRVPDQAGFLVNKLLIPYLLEAIRAYEAGEARKEDIDAAMRLGCGHPKGPLQLCDLVGLDVVAAAAESLYAEYGRRDHQPPVLLRRMVDAGCMGKKSGRGFYVYPRAPEPADVAAEINAVRLDVEGHPDEAIG